MFCVNIFNSAFWNVHMCIQNDISMKCTPESPSNAAESLEKVTPSESF